MKVCEGVYVVKPGEIIYSENLLPKYASSTSTLLLDEFPILVDTGLAENWPLLEVGLAEVGVRAEEIRMVINTHLHIDHMGSNSRFPAKKYIHPSEIDRVRREGFLPRLTAQGEILPFKIDPSKAPPFRPEDYTPYHTPLTQKVSILETPGHVLGHISLVFRGERTVVVAGDAIPTKAHFLERRIPGVHVDARMARRSIEMIEEMASIIIPGHDQPFENHRP